MSRRGRRTGGARPCGVSVRRSLNYSGGRVKQRLRTTTVHAPDTPHQLSTAPGTPPTLEVHHRVRSRDPSAPAPTRGPPPRRSRIAHDARIALGARTAAEGAGRLCWHLTAANGASGSSRAASCGCQRDCRMVTGGPMPWRLTCVERQLSPKRHGS